MKGKSEFLLLLTGIFIFASCSNARQSVIIFPEKSLLNFEWTEDEKQEDVIIRNLTQTDNRSTHIVRIKGKEKPHVHDDHDLTVFVLSGEVLVHFQNKIEKAEAGDVVDIPKGILHWAENIGPKASEAYIVFTPPYDGKDSRLIGK